MQPKFLLFPAQKLCIEKALKFLPKLKAGLKKGGDGDGAGGAGSGAAADLDDVLDEAMWGARLKTDTGPPTAHSPPSALSYCHLPTQCRIVVYRGRFPHWLSVLWRRSSSFAATSFSP